jgi:hypothetical protein
MVEMADVMDHIVRYKCAGEALSAEGSKTVWFARSGGDEDSAKVREEAEAHAMHVIERDVKSRLSFLETLHILVEAPHPDAAVWHLAHVVVSYCNTRLPSDEDAEGLLHERLATALEDLMCGFQAL